MDLVGKKVLITGAAGFIGSNLVKSLSNIEGIKIFALVRKNSNTNVIKKYDINILYGDIKNFDFINKLSQYLIHHEISVIIHTAARVSASGSLKEFEQTNVDGTENIIKATIKSHLIKRFIYISSTSVYGSSREEGVPINENAPLKKSGMPYSDTKIEAEEVVKRYVKETSLPAVVIRPGEVLGYESVWFYPLIRNIKLRKIFLVNGGVGLMNFIWIDDLIDAIILTILKDKSIGQSYNITYGTPIKFGTYFTDICYLIGYSKPKSIPYFLGYIVALLSEFVAKISGIETERTRYMINYLLFMRRINSQKAIRELGWNPKFNYEQVIYKFKIHLLAK